MKRFLKLWLCLVFAAAMQATAQTGKPVVHSYAFDDNGILTGMSDNGLWAVAYATNSSNTLILKTRASWAWIAARSCCCPKVTKRAKASTAVPTM